MRNVLGRCSGSEASAVCDAVRGDGGTGASLLPSVCSLCPDRTLRSLWWSGSDALKHCATHVAASGFASSRHYALALVPQTGDTRDLTGRH